MKLSEHSKDIIDNLVQVMAYLENRHKGYLSVCEDARKEIQTLHELKEKYSDELWNLHVTSTDEIKKLKEENEELRADKTAWDICSHLSTQNDKLRQALKESHELLHKLTAIIPGNDAAGQEVARVLRDADKLKGYGDE